MQDKSNVCIIGYNIIQNIINTIPLLQILNHQDAHTDHSDSSHNDAGHSDCSIS